MTQQDLTPEQNRRRWRYVLVGFALVSALTVSLMTTAIWRGGSLFGSSTEAQVTSTALDFARAVDTQDQAAMLALLCREEVEQVTSDDDYDPDNSSAEDGLSPRPFTIRTVRINSDAAAVDFSRTDPDSQGTLYLTKEDGTWKVCDGAKTRFK